ncbi:MAG TPA: tetratricopeptide repeat protein [Candidatus Ozemobacteraceae bacterium]|nr:tetratricopeptide repeat protein [Candidatus Ozemobacteraceae bacterium]
MRSREAEEHFDRGIHYFRGGFYPAALHEFRTVQRLDPEYPNIGYVLEAARKKNDEVTGQLASFIETSFDDDIQELSRQLVFTGSGALGQQLEELLRRDRPREALEKLDAAGAIVPDSKPFLLLKANLQRRLGRADEAEKTLRQARTLFPGDAEVLNNLGNVYLARGQFRDAEELLTEARSLAPDDMRILNNLGSLRMEMYRLDEALACFEEALRRQPNLGVCRRNLDNLHLRITELDLEVARLRKEFAAHPNYPDIGLSLGKALLFRGAFGEAGTLFEELLHQNPGFIAVYFYLGSLREMQGNYDAAIAAYREMSLRKKLEGSPAFQAADSLLKQGYLEEALVELKKVAVIELDMAASRINLGIKYFEDALWADALRHFEEAAHLNGRYPDAFYWMAMCRLQAGKKAAAERDLRKAIELNPRYADAQFQLGMLLRKKAPARARQHLQQALTLGIRPAFAQMAERALATDPDPETEG